MRNGVEDFKFLFFIIFKVSNGRSFRAHRSLGMLMLHRKHYDIAFKHLKRSLELQPINVSLDFHSLLFFHRKHVGSTRNHHATSAVDGFVVIWCYFHAHDIIVKIPLVGKPHSLQRVDLF